MQKGDSGFTSLSENKWLDGYDSRTRDTRRVSFVLLQINSLLTDTIKCYLVALPYLKMLLY